MQPTFSIHDQILSESYGLMFGLYLTHPSSITTFLEGSRTAFCRTPFQSSWLVHELYRSSGARFHFIPWFRSTSKPSYLQFAFYNIIFWVDSGMTSLSKPVYLFPLHMCRIVIRATTEICRDRLLLTDALKQTLFQQDPLFRANNYDSR